MSRILGLLEEIKNEDFVSKRKEEMDGIGFLIKLDKDTNLKEIKEKLLESFEEDKEIRIDIIEVNDLTKLAQFNVMLGGILKTNELLDKSFYQNEGLTIVIPKKENDVACNCTTCNCDLCSHTEEKEDDKEDIQEDIKEDVIEDVKNSIYSKFSKDVFYAIRRGDIIKVKDCDGDIVVGEVIDTLFDLNHRFEELSLNILENLSSKNKHEDETLNLFAEDIKDIIDITFKNKPKYSLIPAESTEPIYVIHISTGNAVTGEYVGKKTRLKKEEFENAIPDLLYFLNVASKEDFSNFKSNHFKLSKNITPDTKFKKCFIQFIDTDGTLFDVKLDGLI